MLLNKKTDKSRLKIELFNLLILIFSCCACEAQNTELKNLLRNEDKDLRIGMTLKEFNDVQKDYYLVNDDSTLLGQDVISPILMSLIIPDSTQKTNTSKTFLSHQVKKVHYVFDNKKHLVRINWFISNSNEKELVINDIKMILGNPTSSEKDSNENYDKTIWNQDSLTLICNYDINNGRLFISLFNPFNPEDLNIFNVSKKYENLIKINRQGKGNQSFSFSLISLERVVTTGMTVKQFESILPAWQTNIYYNWVGLTTNKKTNIKDVPLFHLAYDFKLQNDYVTAQLEVGKTLDAAITSIEIIYHIDGQSLAKFRTDLKLRGYYLDEKLTSISHNFHENKDIFINRSKGVMAMISTKINGYSFVIRK